MSSPKSLVQTDPAGSSPFFDSGSDLDLLSSVAEIEYSREGESSTSEDERFFFGKPPAPSHSVFFFFLN
jgi:hypothetical protein